MDGVNRVWVLFDPQGNFTVWRRKQKALDSLPIRTRSAAVEKSTGVIEFGKIKKYRLYLKKIVDAGGL